MSFDVARGEIFGLLGQNGAGKTTLMRILLGLLRPAGGTALVCGAAVGSATGAVRHTVGWVPQDRAVDPLLTARENLRFVAGLHHLDRSTARRRAAELLDRVGLAGHADRLVHDYSGGMRRRLELAMGLIHAPAVVLLDEPTLGLDVSARRRLWGYVREIRDAGTTVLMTSHYLDEADALCDRVAIIHDARIRALGAPTELKRRHSAVDMSLDDVFLTVTGYDLADANAHS